MAASCAELSFGEDPLHGGSSPGQKRFLSAGHAKGASGTIAVFARGSGQTDPPGNDGQITGNTHPRPLLPVSVQIGGREATVVSAEAVPGSVSGLLRLNCVVPLDSPSGYAVPIMLSVGTTSSPAGVTLAIG